MVEEEPNAREWTGCGMPELTPTEWRKLRPVDTVIWFRCPKCLGHLEHQDDVHQGQRDLMWECPRCSLRMRIWKYHPGDRTVIP